MSIDTVSSPPRSKAAEERESSAVPDGGRRTGLKVLAILVVWVVGWALLHGRQTLALGRADLTDLHRWLNDLRDDVEAARRGNFFLDTLIGTVADALNTVFDFLSELISVPAFPRPVPDIGWLGVLALFVWLALALAGWRSAVLVGLAMASFGFLGVWSDAMDLLIVTAMTVVICIAVGIPLAITMVRNRAVSAVVTPVLEAMQTVPAFAYLTPLALFWGIGPAAAIVVTFIYSLPPLVRITELGLRGVSASTVEAARSLGVSRGQLLRQVQLPMAKRTIVVGINQCTMAALSMATISALINGPGLGGPVSDALQSIDVGTAAVTGMAIVILAIMLDRTTTAASERAEAQSRRGDVPTHSRRLVLLAGLVVTGVAIWVSRRYLWAATFPEEYDVRRDLSDWVTSTTDSVVGTIDGTTEAIKNAFSYGLLNPLQSLLAESPWWLMAGVLIGLGYVLGGVRAAVTTVVCVAVILGTGLWYDSMVTLTMTLIATVMVMAIAVVVGVVMGRKRGADLVVRPFLDALQTIPAFAYLVPVLALFGPTRFTAIIAAVLFAAPIATKLVADGIRGVSPTTVEAAVSAGSTPWQIITRVQLPMARENLVLAANQGLLYVLSMVVIGALVGGGGLGNLVVTGFVQGQIFGKGLAAAVAITALGFMLDRITRNTAARYGRQ